MLQELASPEGGKLLGLQQGGTAQDALRKTVTLEALKIKTDGTDQTNEFQRAINYLESLTEYWTIDGKGEEISVTNGIRINIQKLGIMNVSIKYTYLSGITPKKSVYILDINGSGNIALEEFNKPILKNIHVVGPTNRDRAPIYAYKFNPEGNLANIIVDNCSSRNTNAALVFGSNAYLITFENFTASGFITGITDTIVTGDEKKISNAGENIRFNGGVFFNSRSIMDILGMVVTFSFNNTSFDYTGDDINIDAVQFRLRKNGINLNMNNCHFESGNKFSGVTANYFEAEESVCVNIIGGWIIFGSKKYNKIPYFFYDKNYGKASFKLDGTKIWGMSIEKWSNIVPDKFMPIINFDNSMASSKISDRCPWLIDQTFKEKLIVDNWFANGERISRLESEKIKLERTEIRILEANYPALKITRKNSDNNAIAAIYAKVSNNAFKPSVTFKIRADSNIELKKGIEIKICLLKKSNIIDSHGTPNIDKKTTIWSSRIRKLTTDFVDTTICAQLIKDQICIGYDEVGIFINIDELPFPLVKAIYITDFVINKPF